MSTKLYISDELSLPLDIITMRTALYGTGWMHGNQPTPSFLAGHAGFIFDAPMREKTQ